MTVEILLTHKAEWIRILAFFLYKNKKQFQLQDLCEDRDTRRDPDYLWTQKKDIYRYYLWFEIKQKKFCVFSSFETDLLFLNSEKGTFSSLNINDLVKYLNEA